MEGQLLPEVNSIMFNDQRWEKNYSPNWEYVKSTWLKYWNTNKSVLVEKSPPNLLRAHEINKVFNPAYFICFVRNPYALAEGLMFRTNQSIKDIGAFIIMCFEAQLTNINMLPNNILVSYEELVEQPFNTIEKISNFLPVLNDLKVQDSYTSYNRDKSPQGLSNFNHEKIERLKKQVTIEQLNRVFSPHKSLFESFGYQLID